ncbi:MAG: hypothetical protein SAK29_02015 [Scytonema sp. PMC 1069.18]|nr:hypothetical protein [Scytonema sp. PMC 1069.18]MEC4885280.1 hypothetical protein [Scytonema sp. PMC 1070.18]
MYVHLYSEWNFGNKRKQPQLYVGYSELKHYRLKKLIADAILPFTFELNDPS